MAPRILFLADSGAAVGGGHVMRTLTLGAAVERHGAERLHVTAPGGAAVVQAFGEGAAHQVVEGGDDPATLAQAAAAIAADWGAQVVVVDHYRLDAGAEAELAQGRALAVIDDLADRAHPCALLIDPGLGREGEDYRGLVPDGAQVLAGADYALVRPQFYALRDVSLFRRGPGAPVRRALVSMGLTDLDGITGRVLRALAATLGDVEVDVVVGSAAPSVRSLIDQAWSDRRLHVHVDTPDMARLIGQADVAVGAGGSSVWERACMGLPSILVVLADNQRQLAGRLAEAGAALALDARDEDFEARLVEAWGRLSCDGELRAELSARSAALCDGRGAERAAAALLDLV